MCHGIDIYYCNESSSWSTRRITDKIHLHVLHCTARHCSILYRTGTTLCRHDAQTHSLHHKQTHTHTARKQHTHHTTHTTRTQHTHTTHTPHTYLFDVLYANPPFLPDVIREGENREIKMLSRVKVSPNNVIEQYNAVEIHFLGTKEGTFFLGSKELLFIRAEVNTLESI